MTYLDNILDFKRREVEEKKNLLKIKDLERISSLLTPRPSFRESILKFRYSIIAEYKRKSPSKGWINPDALPEEVAAGYEKNGAAAISVLADREFFAGSPEFVGRVADRVSVPVLFKEFIIDEYQIYEAAAYGASAILLIAAALKAVEVRRLALLAKSLGMESLLEIHDRKETEHICPEIAVTGVNNRNLYTFRVDINKSVELCRYIPDEMIKISESGISSPDSVKILAGAGFRGFLMGENFMKESDPAEALNKFILNLNN
jgi:indole-3-glycerol phosphate synthase